MNVLESVRNICLSSVVMTFSTTWFKAAPSVMLAGPDIMGSCRLVLASSSFYRRKEVSCTEMLINSISILIFYSLFSLKSNKIQYLALAQLCTLMCESICIWIKFKWRRNSFAWVVFSQNVRFRCACELWSFSFFSFQCYFQRPLTCLSMWWSHISLCGNYSLFWESCA